MYMMNNLKAYLMYLNNGNAEKQEFAVDPNGFEGEIFFFTQYVPGTVQVYSDYTGIMSVGAAAAFPWVGNMQVLEPFPYVLQDISNSTVIVPTVTDDLAFSELTAGETVTAGVDVFGSSVYFVAQLHDLFDVAVRAIDPYLWAMMQAPGGTVRSPVQVSSVNSTDSTMGAQVILQETDYTQAMADADNIITYTEGAYTVTAKIVGLWAANALGV